MFCFNETFVFLQIWSVGTGPSGRFLFLILFSWLLLLVIGLRLAESNPCLLTHLVIRNRPFGQIPFLIIFSWLLLLIQGLLSGRIYACLWLQRNLCLLAHLVIRNRPFGPIPLLNHLLLAVAVDPGLAFGSGLRMCFASMKPLSSCKSGQLESALRADSFF